MNRIYTDRGLESCRAELAEMGSELICCDKNVHVRFAERGICFIKETIRCIRSMLPAGIKRIPKRLMTESVYPTTAMMNNSQERRSARDNITQNSCYRQETQNSTIFTRILYRWDLWE